MLKKRIFLPIVFCFGIFLFQSQTKIDILEQELSKKQKSYTFKTIKYKNVTFEILVLGDPAFDTVIKKIYQYSKKKDFSCYDDEGEIKVYLKVNEFTDNFLSVTKSVQISGCGYLTNVDYDESFNYMKYKGKILSVKLNSEFVKRKTTISRIKELLENELDCVNSIDKDGMSYRDLFFSEGKGYLMNPVLNKFCEISIPIEINDENIVFEKFRKVRDSRGN